MTDVGRPGAAGIDLDRITRSFRKADEWVQAHKGLGYDPFDGLSSTWARPLTFEVPILRMVLEQTVKRSPVNLRPALRIRPAASSKSAGLFAAALLGAYRVFGDDEYASRARSLLDQLLASPTPGYSGLCWGNAYDHQSRSFYYPKEIPTLVGSAFIAHAFLDAFDALGDEAYARAASSCAQFVLSDLERIETGKGVCLGYIPGARTIIHNASALGAALLARVASVTGEGEAADVAAAAIESVLAAQNGDGSWHYGEGIGLGWVDNFHTGYVLVSLDDYSRYGATSRRSDVGMAITRGLDFYVGRFFLEEGIPRYYHDRTYPVDIQCVSQSLITLSTLRDYDERCMPLCGKVADWGLSNMQDADGHFYFRRTRFRVDRTPMVYWGQANMCDALATVLEQTLASRGVRVPAANMEGDAER